MPRLKLNDRDLATYVFVAHQFAVDTDDVAAALDVKRDAAYRTLRKLESLGLVACDLQDGDDGTNRDRGAQVAKRNIWQAMEDLQDEAADSLILRAWATVGEHPTVNEESLRLAAVAAAHRIGVLNDDAVAAAAAEATGPSDADIATAIEQLNAEMATPEFAAAIDAVVNATTADVVAPDVAPTTTKRTRRQADPKVKPGKGKGKGKGTRQRAASTPKATNGARSAEVAAKKADVVARAKAGASIGDIAKAVGHSTAYVRDILIKAGAHAVTPRGDTAERDAKIVAAYGTHQSIAKAAEDTGVSIPVARRALRAAGVTIARTSAPAFDVTPVVLERVAALEADFGAAISTIARAVTAARKA